MKTYSGKQSGGGGGQRVELAEGTRRTILNARTDLWNHSPDGFQWGYGGSGPAQLALALLADATGDDQLAIRLHQPFKWQFVAAFGSSWSLTQNEILAWVKLKTEAKSA